MCCTVKGMSQVLWAPRRGTDTSGVNPEKGLLRGNVTESCNEYKQVHHTQQPRQHVLSCSDTLETKKPRRTMTSPEVAFQVVKPRPENSKHLFTLKAEGGVKYHERKKAGGRRSGEWQVRGHKATWSRVARPHAAETGEGPPLEIPSSATSRV